jgi:two-component system probable response regulator PhcQ
MSEPKERHILLVDDEEQVRAALGAVLRREGYTVHLAESGEAGLLALKEKPIQLVISDHHMPGISGLEFLKLVRERHPHVLRIMLTGDDDPQMIIRSINEGEVYRFLRKPWDNITVRVTVYFAFETIQLQDENRLLLGALRRQLTFLHDLELQFPYAAATFRDEQKELEQVAARPAEKG